MLRFEAFLPSHEHLDVHKRILLVKIEIVVGPHEALDKETNLFLAMLSHISSITVATQPVFWAESIAGWFEPRSNAQGGGL